MGSGVRWLVAVLLGVLLLASAADAAAPTIRAFSAGMTARGYPDKIAAGLAASAGPARRSSAQETVTIHVRAYIDGGSDLILSGSTAQWHQLGAAAPGRLNGANEPTTINGVDWLPSWPDQPTPENRDCNCDSSTFAGVSPPLPADLSGAKLSFSAIACRFACSASIKGNEVVINFDDGPPPGADWYEVEVTVTPAPPDATAPTVQVPGAFAVEATGPSGAVANWSATATDPDDAAGPVSCVPGSGSTLPLGTTLVSCSSTDTHGNTGTGSFTVTVRDTTAPDLRLPKRALRVTATSKQGRKLSFVEVAKDLVDGRLAETCAPPHRTSSNSGRPSSAAAPGTTPATRRQAASRSSSRGRRSSTRPSRESSDTTGAKAAIRVHEHPRVLLLVSLLFEENKKPAFAGLLMVELAGLEPATSWVRSGKDQLLLDASQEVGRPR